MEPTHLPTDSLSGFGRLPVGDPTALRLRGPFGCPGETVRVRRPEHHFDWSAVTVRVRRPEHDHETCSHAYGYEILVDLKIQEKMSSFSKTRKGKT